ncbi:MAG: hypothetical protein A2W19_14345 [Spirochaetes bacterium RBG_16_49_21]|nr:MAG: hypothetical protein A2W19_14345 [Spirochaetes bacterium RBG_16_49_21]
MKKINDSRIYRYSAIITLIIGITLGAVSFYSILVVEPAVEQLLSARENIDANYKKAYIILRDPQIFAGYDNFDSDRVRNSLTFFDGKIYADEKIDQERKIYLEVLLERRKEGSLLGRNTMVYFFLLSMAAWILFFNERSTAVR